MAPTIQSDNADRDRRQQQRQGDRRSEILCRVKYCNTLPDIPFDLKFITYPFETTRYIQYNPTSLERNYRYEVLTEHDLGVHIDLINREIYQSDGYAQLDPADEKLLEEDVLTPQDSKRSRHHAKSVSWLRRSEYISTEQTRFQPQTMEKVEAKVGYNVKKTFREETLYMDRDSQIKAIDKTFEDNKVAIEKHYSKPGVTPVEVMSIYPDFDLWKYPCAQVIFDSDPAPTDKNISAQIEQMSQAMIRGVMDESGEQFVAYFLPTDDTLQLRRKDTTENLPYTDGESYEYKMAREYNWNVKSKASKGYEENYFLVVRNGNVYYNELETRVRLSKRRARGPAATTGSTRLIVSHRPLGLREHRMLRLREKQLEPIQITQCERASSADIVLMTSERVNEVSSLPPNRIKSISSSFQDDEEEEDEEEEEPQPEQESHRTSRSRSKSGSPVPSRNGKSPGSNRSASGSRPASRQRSRSRSGSNASSKASRKSRSRSVSRRSGSHKSKSGSPRSGSGSARSRSGSGSRRSRSGSRKSGSGSPRSRSGSGSGSARSRSGSARSGSGSPGSAHSKSASRASSRSGSPSNVGSKASSRKNSKSGSGSERSGSGSRQGSRSGSASSRSGSGSRHSGSESE